MTFEGNPQVIVSDRDLTLMNVIDNVFLDCSHLLCRFHIHKNVQAKCKMLVNFFDARDVMIEAWENVMYCEDESTFTDCVDRLRHVCISWPLFFEYVNESWTIPYKKILCKGMDKSSNAFRKHNIKHVCFIVIFISYLFTSLIILFMLNVITLSQCTRA